MTDGLLYYFGDDKVFFNGLKTIFDNAVHKTTFKKFFATQEASIQSLFQEVVNGKPDAVLIDFSLHSEDYLHLARILSRTPFEKDIKIIGVFDHLKLDEVLIEAQSTGISLCFIKSEQNKDIANTLDRLVFPKKASSPHYVKAKLSENWETGLVSKVGYLTGTGIHFETNLKLREGETISLDHFWRNKILIPSKQVVIKKVMEEDLVYNFGYGVDANFEFVDRVEKADQTPEEEVKRYQLIDDVKYRFRKVFLKNLEHSRQKIAKVMILDSQFSIYQGKRSDRFPYMLRSLGSEKNLINELSKFNPQIIVISLDENISKETVSEVKKWCVKKGSNPYLIIFNSEESGPQWQTLLNYKNILASREEINTDILLKIATIYEAKIKNLNKGEEKKIFISKTKEESNCQIELSIKVTHLSECDITFISKKKIPLGSNLIVRTPIKSLIYIVSETEGDGGFQYEGILHSNGALEKNSIRRYINAILFKENASDSEEDEGDAKLSNILKNSHLKVE